MGCLLCNNRKCGNEKKCLHTQEDTGREKTVQNQDRMSTALASWERGERMMRRGWETPAGTVAAAGAGGGLDTQDEVLDFHDHGNKSTSLDRNVGVPLEAIKNFQCHPRTRT